MRTFISRDWLQGWKNKIHESFKSPASMQPHLPHHIVSSFLTMISVNEIIMEVGRLRIKRYGQVEQ